MPKLKMSIIENALDFLDEAVERLLNDQSQHSTDTKYAILHLFSAVELILKYTVMINHQDGWKAIVRYKKGEIELTKENFLVGKLNTIGADKARKILTNNLNISISADQQEIIDRLKSERNQIEHLNIDLDKYVASSLLLSTWSFIVDFISANIELKNASEEIYGEIEEKIFQLEEFVEHRIKEIQPRLDRFQIGGENLLVHCPACNKKTLPLGMENMVCVYCETDFKSEGVLDKWARRNVWGNVTASDLLTAMNENLSQCPECDYYMLLFNIDHNKDIPADFFCFNCGNYWMVGELSECTVCNEPFRSMGNELICGECLNHKINNSS